MSTYHYDRILDDIKTVEDLHLIAAEIDMLVVSVYKSDPAVFRNALSNLQRNLTDAITLSLKEQNISFDNHQELQHYFHGLKQFITSLPVLQLTLAYHPNNEQIEKLVAWARQTTEKPIILQLHYNQHILGGAIITFEGRYLDLSLKKKLDIAYESKRNEVLAMLK